MYSIFNIFFIHYLGISTKKIAVKILNIHIWKKKILIPKTDISINVNPGGNETQLFIATFLEIDVVTSEERCTFYHWCKSIIKHNGDEKRTFELVFMGFFSLWLLN